MIFYHGARQGNLSSILSAGLRPGYGWGAESPGVFLSKDFETANYWAAASAEKSNIKDDYVVLQVNIPDDQMMNVIPRKTSFAKPGDVQYLGHIPKEWVSKAKMRQQENLIRQYVRVILSEISKSTPEFASGEKYLDKITPFGNYGMLRPPETPEEKAYNDEFVDFLIKKYDEIFETGGFYTKRFLETGKLSTLTADDYIDQPYAGDIIHALAHESTMKGAYKRFKFQGRDIDRPEINDNLYEIMVYWIQSNPEQAKRVGGSDSLIVQSITNRLDKKSKPALDVVRDFVNRYGSQFDESIILRYFPDMADEIGGNEPAMLPENVQLEFFAALKNVIGRAAKEKKEDLVTPLQLFGQVITRFTKTMIGDPTLGKMARRDYVPEDHAQKLMSWYNVIRLKSLALAKRYGVNIEDIHKKFKKEE